MRQELDDLLCARYPDLFCDRQASPFEVVWAMDSPAEMADSSSSTVCALRFQPIQNQASHRQSLSGKSKKNWEGCASALAAATMKFAI